MKTGRFGFTLSEVLVAMFITSLLALMLVNLFSTSRTALEHGATHMEITQKARIAADRMLPFISSACQFSGVDGLPYPQMGLNSSLQLDDPETWPQHVVFQTTEDFLDPAYTGTFATTYPNLLADVYDTYYYAVWMEGDGTGTGWNLLPNDANCVVLGRLGFRGDLEAAGVNLADSTWLSDPWAQFSGNQQDYQVLARDLDSVRFRRLYDNAVVVRIRAVDTVRGATNQKRDLTYDNQAIIQLPSFTYE